MARRRVKKPAAAAHLAATTGAGTSSAAAASTSQDVEMPTTSDSLNSPAPPDSQPSDGVCVKKRKAGSTRTRAEPGMREILRLTRDNFSAFEKPPTGARRRCTARGETVPAEQQQQASRAWGSSSSAPANAGPSSPAPSSGLSSLASSDAESDQEEGSSASSSENKDGAASSKCAGRGSRSPSPTTSDAPADLAAMTEVALPHDRPPVAATSVATDQAASSNASFERSPDQAKSNKRRRAPKRPTSEVAMLQRDYFAASQDDLLADSKQKRAKRKQAFANPAPTSSSSSSVANSLEEAVLPSAEPVANVPIESKPVAPATKTKKRRAESHQPDLPPSELRWLKNDYFSATRQPVQGKRSSHSRKKVETARRLGTVREAKRARMDKGDAGDANSPPPPPPPPKKRRRTAVSPELVGPERVSQPGPSDEREEAAQHREISPELFAASWANPAPLASHVPQAVILPESPPTISPDGDPRNASPGIHGIEDISVATEHSSLPKKRQRKRPARYADGGDAPDTGGAANKPAVSASNLASQPGVLENDPRSTSGPLEGDRTPKKPTAPKRGRPPKAVAQVIHPADPSALTDNVIADRSGPAIRPQEASPPIRPQEASPLAALSVQAEITKSSKSMQPTPLGMVPPPKKREKPRTRHAAFDSRETWVKPERDLKLRENGRPPIWCEGRQELCETLDYFKSYQGGHYDLQERCLGYLLDGFGTANDVCAENGKIVISHGGGCSEVIDGPARPGSKGEPQRIFRLKASQTRDNVRMRALFNCKDTKTPVVLLAGTQWPFFPRLKDLGKTNDEDSSVRYAVLGHYLVTHIWAEGETVDHIHEPVASSSATPAGPDFFARFKVRFEWVPGQGKPWFDDVIGGTRTGPAAALESPDPSSPPMSDGLSDAFSMDSGFVDSTTPPPPSPDTRQALEAQNDFVTCATCERGHPRIYEEDVTCYNEACPNFFRLGGCMPRPDSLTYAGALVRTTDLPEDSLVPEPLCPRTLQQLAGAPSISDFSEQAWRGFGCSACGRLSSRSDWTRLRCSGCGAETAAKGSASLDHVGRRFGEQWQPRRADIGGPKPAYVLPEFRVTPIEHVPGYEGYMVELLEGAEHADGVGHARVHHMWPVTEAASRPADELFEAYQGEEAGELFERNRLTRHAAVGALRCQQFTFNAGCHYKHVIGAETYPFPPIKADTASTTATASSDAETIIYAPTCARDGRDHLTNIVNALKGTRYSAYTQFNEILSVAYMSGGRMNYHDDGERGLGPFVASISLGSDAVMSFRRKETKKRSRARTTADRSKESLVSPATSDSSAGDEAREIPIPTLDGVKKSRSTTQRAALKIRLKHGDVMLMEGEEMQRQFEHKVEPEGLRFAATARFIGPDHLQPSSGATATRRCAKKKELAASPGQGVPSRFAYQDKEEASDYPTIPTSLAGWTLPALPALPSLSLPAVSSCTRVSASPLIDSDAGDSVAAVPAPCESVGEAAPRVLQEGPQPLAAAAAAAAAAAPAPLPRSHSRLTAATMANVEVSLPPSPAPSFASVSRSDGPPEPEPPVRASPSTGELSHSALSSSCLSQRGPTRYPTRPPPPPPHPPPHPSRPVVSAASTSSVPIDEPRALGPQQNGAHNHHPHPQPLETGGGGGGSSTHAAALAPAAQFPREAWNVGAQVYAQMAPAPPPRMNAFDAGASRSSAKERRQQDLLRRAQPWSPSSSSSYPMPVANQFIPAATTASITGGHAAFARRYF